MTISILYIQGTTFAATVSSYAPQRGTSGSPVNVLGNGFDTITNVQVVFGNTQALNPQIINPMVIRATVPAIPDGVYVLTLRFNDASGASITQVLGGFTFGPPLVGLQVTGVFPNPVPSGGGTLFILGNGFLQNGRTDSVIVKFNGAIAVAAQGTTINDSLIQVSSAPSATSLGLHPGDCFHFTVGFSDGSAASNSACYTLQ